MRIEVERLNPFDYEVGGYIVSYNINKRLWSCQCMGWTFYGGDTDFNCKHIKLVKKMLNIEDGKC